MKGLYGIILFVLLSAPSLFGQITSLNDGDWDDTGTWSCGCVPDPFGFQEVRISHNVTIDDDAEVNWVRVLNGGQLTVDAGVTVTFIEDFINAPLYIESGGRVVNNGTLDLITQVYITESPVYGVLENSSVVDAGEALLHFYAGSRYVHNTSSGGNIPPAIWNKTSTVEITNLTDPSPAPPGNLTQTFGNFIWNTPSMTAANVSLGGALQDITGDLTFQATNSRPVYLASGGSGLNLEVDESLIIHAGTTVFLTNNLSSISNIRIKHFVQDGGNLIFGTNPFGIDLRISGNLTKTGGAWNAGSGSIRRIIFNGTGTPQIFTSTGAGINASTVLAFLVEPNAVLDLGTEPMVNGTNGSFTLQGTVLVRSLDTEGALAGNIPINNRTFASGSTINYIGAGPQFIGEGHPDAEVHPGVNTIISTEVTIAPATSTVSIGGTLNLAGGNLNIGANGKLILYGAFTRSGSYGLGILDNSDLEINGAGAFGTLYTVGNTIGDFKLLRGSQTVFLGNDLTISGVFTQSAGNLNYAGRTLTIVDDYVLEVPGGNLTGDASSTLIISGTADMATLPLNGSIGILEINREAGAANTTSVTVVDELRLLGGEFGGSGAVNLTPGIVLTRGDGFTSKVFTVSTYDLVYVNGGPIQTGNELITSALNNLTIRGNNEVALHPTNVSSLTVRGTLSLENGEFISNGKPVVIEGDFVSNATGTFTGSTVTFAGNTTLSGATAITLEDVEIASEATLNLGSSVQLSITGDVVLQSGATMVAGSSTTTFAGTSVVTLPDVETAARFHHLTIAPEGSLEIACVSCGTANNRPAVVLTGNWNSNQTGAVFLPGATTSVRLEGTNNQGIALLETGTPHAFSNLQIGGSGTAVLQTALRVTADLELEGSKTLSTGPSNRSIYIGSDFIFDGGSFLANQGTVYFNGSSVQRIARFSGSGTPTFHNIMLEQTGGTFLVETNVNLRNRFEIGTSHAGTVVDFDGGTTTTGTNVFTLLSTESSTAYIAAIPNPAIVFGNITAQRYMSGNEGQIYRYIASPVTGARVVDLQGEIPVTGEFTGSSWSAPTNCEGCLPCTNCVNNNQSLFYLNETKTGLSLNNRYDPFPQSSNQETFQVGRGYSVFVREGVNPTTWNLRGTVTKGQQPLPVTYSGSSGADGWNLVGNPYPSTIDWFVADNGTTWTRTNIDPTIYLWDESIQNYATYNRSLGAAGTGTFGGSRYIAAGQAFWVRATGPSPSLVAREGVKANQPGTEFLRISPLNMMRMTLIADGRERDQALLVTDIDGASDQYDQSIDSYKMFGTVNLYSFSEDQRALAINVLGSMGCSKEIRMGFDGAKPGAYSIRFSDFDNFASEAELYLVDKFTGGSFPLTSGSTIYDFEVTADSASFDLHRFSLLVSKEPVATDIVTQADDICGSADARLDLVSSQSNILYYATLNGTTISPEVQGTGGLITLLIPHDNIQAGENVVMVMARPVGCTPIPLEHGVRITKESVPAVSKVDHGVSCNGGSVSIRAYGAPAGAFYNWYESVDASQAIAGAKSDVLTLESLNKSKTYYVSITSPLGCESGRVEARAEVNFFEDAKIEITGDKLVSNHTAGNQWYLDGQKIEGATGQEFKPLKSGVYTLEVSAGACTTGTQVEYVVTSIDDPALVGVDVYPNPTAGKVKVNVNSSNSVTISLYNSVGVKLISNLRLAESGPNSRTAEIDLSEGTAGFYLIEILDGEQVKWKKVLRK